MENELLTAVVVDSISWFCGSWRAIASPISLGVFGPVDFRLFVCFQKEDRKGRKGRKERLMSQRYCQIDDVWVN